MTTELVPAKEGTGTGQGTGKQYRSLFEIGRDFELHPATVVEVIRQHWGEEYLDLKHGTIVTPIDFGEFVDLLDELLRLRDDLFYCQHCKMLFAGMDSSDLVSSGLVDEEDLVDDYDGPYVADCCDLCGHNDVYSFEMFMMDLLQIDPGEFE